MKLDSDGIIIFIVAAIAICFLSFLWSIGSENNKQCRDSGGAYVQSFDGYSCIQRVQK